MKKKGKVIVYDLIKDNCVLNWHEGCCAVYLFNCQLDKKYVKDISGSEVTLTREMSPLHRPEDMSGGHLFSLMIDV